MSEADALKDWNDRGVGCTEKQAEAFVDDLINAFHDYEVFGKPGHREHYLATKRKMIDALCRGPALPSQHSSPQIISETVHRGTPKV